MPRLLLHSIKPRDLISFALILLIAAGLRLGDAGAMEFFHDEAMLSILAQDMSRGGDVPLVGIISSVGIPNPPVSVYVMALPYLLSDDPLLATLFVAGLNVLGVGLLWGIAHRYFSPTIALVAGLTYAVNPWAVLYSRKIWAQDFVTPFLLLAILLGLLGFVERKRWAGVLCLPVLLFALQIHFAAWALLPLYGVFLWMGWRERAAVSGDPAMGDPPGRPYAVIGLTLVLSMLVMLPFMLGIVETLAQDPTRISDAINRSDAGEGLRLSPDALRYTAYLSTGLGVETWVAPNQQAALLERVPVLSGVWLLLGGLMLIGLIAVVARARYRRRAVLLWAWAGLPLLVFTPTWTTVYPHYFIGAIPAYALLIGLGLEALIALAGTLIAMGSERITTPGNASLVRTLLLVSCGIILLIQGMWWRGLMRYVQTEAITLGAGTSGYTTPLRYLLPVRDAVRAFDDVVILSQGMDVLFEVEPARWAVLLRDSARCVRTLPGDGFAVFPVGRVAAVIAPDASNSMLMSLYTDSEAQVYPTHPGEGAYTVSTFEAAPAWAEVEAAINPLPTPTVFANGVTLTAYAISQQDGRVYLQWTLPQGAAAGADFQYFIHLLDSSGEVIAQRDASFWMGRHWCPGDRLLSWQTLDLPPTATTLRVGFYTLGVGKDAGRYFPVDVLDAMGNPAGNWVDIGMSPSS